MYWKLYLMQLLCMKLLPHAYGELRHFSMHNETTYLALALWYALFLIKYMHAYIYAQVKRNAWKHTKLTSCLCFCMIITAYMASIQ